MNDSDVKTAYKGVLQTVPAFSWKGIYTNQALVFLTDILFISLALYSAYQVRFDGQMSEFQSQQLLELIPCFILLKMPIFTLMGLYRGMWRYTSLGDLLNIGRAVLLSSLVLIAAFMLINRFTGLSRAVFVIDALFTFCLISGNRLSIRYLYQVEHSPLQTFRGFLGMGGENRGRRLILIGAGNNADKVIREIRENSNLSATVAGLVDDEPKKKGLRIHGAPVLGDIDDLPTLAAWHGATELLITISTASAQQMQHIVNRCRETSLPYKIIPGMPELIDGRVSLNDVREVDYQDLLGRPAVKLEAGKIGRYIAGRTVLVTGAGGSIGSELCRQILKFAPGKLILFDAGEENLYNIQMALQHEFDFSDHVAVLGKIQNRSLLEKIFITHQPTVVFHAAAYKHVPLIEINPWEAVFNNVFAVRNLIEVAINYQVERFVLVSTDKAVRPTNVMGASKRLTELLMLAYTEEKWDASICRDRRDWLEKSCTLTEGDCPRHATTFMAVRFGNVLGSSGSVIPLFKRQIAMGGPVTVTHPEVTRYFMSIEEAAQLILQAGSMGQGGEIFILKMGEPINIATMARELIVMSGKEPETEIEISFTGLRPGEKLYEELITEGEGVVPTGHDKIMVLRGDGRFYRELEGPLSRLAERAQAHDALGIKMVLSEIIPEYHPDLGSMLTTPTRKESGDLCN